MRGLLRAALALLIALWTSATVAETFQVEDIKVVGLERISAGTVFTYLPVQVGERFDTQRTPEVIRALYKTGFFEDVELRRRNNVLVVSVVERPAIAEVEVTGNDDIGDEQLDQALRQVGLVKGRVFNRSVLERMERELRQQYFARGKYNVRIDTQVKELARNRVAVAIDISEGQVAKIRKVTIVGNDAYDDETLLDQLDSGVPAPWAVFSSRDEYSKQKLSSDLETLKSHYLDHGYLNFNIESTQVSMTPDKKELYITINVDEGERFRVSKVKLAGDLILPEGELRELVPMESGEIFSRAEVTEAVQAISERLGDRGYAFANVNPVPEVDEEANEVALTLFVDPGQRVYVRRINFHGNDQTKDEVLRREMRQMESAWYATSKIDRSKVRIQRLSYVESVDIETRRVAGQNDQVDLDVTVTERRSGQLVVGAGFSQSQGLLLNLNVSQNNFLGEGKRLSVDVNTSSVNTIYSLSYNNPYYTIDGISRGFRLFYRETDAEELDISEYSTDRAGARVNFGIPLTEYDTFRPEVGAESIKVDASDSAAVEVTDFLDENGDSFTVLPLEADVVHDTRNRTVFPDKGNLQRLGTEIAVPVGDLRYYKLDYRNQLYLPLTEDFILSLNGELSYGDSYAETSDLPFFEKFFAGGINSVRGYEANSLGPEDSTGDPFGGNFRTIGSAEVLFPMPFAPDTRSLRMGAFVDAGNVFVDYDQFAFGELRASAGVSMSWLSPVGALTFSLAKALNAEAGDETQVFQFTVGASF